MKKMMSKAISMLLALMMVFCIIPMSALADTHTANTLNYDANGGEGAPASATSDTNTIVVDSTVPTRTGYDFLGWNSTAAGDGITYSAGNTYTFMDDTGAGGCVATLYAKWEIKEYNVTFIVDGAVHSTVKVNHGENAELPAIPSKSGYDEVAPTWDKDGKNITENTVITAVYTVNGYEDVLAVYNAYTAVKTALEGSSVEALETAVEEFTAISENSYEMTEEQGEELLKMLNMSAEDFIVDVLTTSINAALVVEASYIYDAYNDNPTIKTAYDLVTLYDGVFNDSELDYESEDEYDIEEFKALINRFFPDIDTVYADALNNLPSESVMDTYDAYNEIEIYIGFGFIEELKTTLETYKEALDNVENMTEAEKNDLSVLMEVTPGEAVELVISAVKNAKALVEINDVYNAFIDANDEATARALVEKYDALSDDEDLVALIKDTIYDIDEIYAEALKLIPEPEKEPSEPENDGDKEETTSKSDTTKTIDSTASKTDKSETKTEESGKDDSETSPKTGDNGADLWVILTLISAAMIMALAIYNKKVKATK